MGLLLYCFQIGLIKKDIHYLLSECFRIKGNKISVFCVYAYRFCFNYCFDVICWAATNTAIRLNTVFFFILLLLSMVSLLRHNVQWFRGALLKHFATSPSFLFELLFDYTYLYVLQLCAGILGFFFSAPLNAQLMNLPQSSSFILRLNWSASGDDELR